MYVGDLETGNARRLLDAEPRLCSGHLLFVRQGTLLAQPFDPARAAAHGQSDRRGATGARVRGQGVAALSASAAGSIAFRSGPPSAEGQFVWFDRAGKVLETVAGSDGPGFNSALSPDERWLALNKVTNGNRDLWLLELSRGVQPIHVLTGVPAIPVWSPDGRQLAFASNRRGTMDVYVKPVVGPEATNSSWRSTGVRMRRAMVSRWHNLLLYSTDDKDIWALPGCGAIARPFLLSKTPFEEVNGQFSPDRRWIAYQSNESGRFEIYVQRFPGPGPKTLVSRGGGLGPLAAGRQGTLRSCPRQRAHGGSHPARRVR